MIELALRESESYCNEGDRGEKVMPDKEALSCVPSRRLKSVIENNVRMLDKRTF